MDIIPFEEKHRDSLQQLYTEVRKETFTWLENTEFKFGDFDKDTEGEHILVAEIDGEVAGFAAVWTPDSFLHHLYVELSYQGHGVGTALLRSANELSERSLSLKCMTDNSQAVAFYLYHGWDIQAEESDDSGPYFLMEKVK